MWHFQMGLLVHTTHDTLALFLFDYAVKSYGNMVRHHLVLWVICCGLTGADILEWGDRRYALCCTPDMPLSQQ